ncbi:hypothetical protein MNBD_ALPHA11-1909, partial [hydrothermal vent metagenome]
QGPKHDIEHIISKQFADQIKKQPQNEIS